MIKTKKRKGSKNELELNVPTLSRLPVLFSYTPERKTVQVLLLGCISILLSLAMNYVPQYGLLSLILRDILQISLFGVIIPIQILRRSHDLQEAGVRYDRAWLFIPISIILGLLTFYMIAGDLNYLNRIFIKELVGASLYVMTANVFEVLFFYIFIRFYLEKAFGLLPALILSAAIYSLHHAGFQPEFMKLFIVGLIYFSIFRMANNWLICFPLWWAGGLGDVLFQSELTHPELIKGYRSIIPAIIIILSLIPLLKRPDRSEQNLS